MAFSGWSTTAANNTNAATGVNFDEGQAPSTINDSGRELMAQLRAVVVFVLDRDVTQTEVVSTTTETTVYSFSVPANTLSTNRMLRLNMLGDYLNNSGAINNLTLRVKFGGTTVATLLMPNTTSDTNRAFASLISEISANNATNSQIAATRGWLSVGAAGLTDGTVTAQTNTWYSMHNAVAVDSTAAATISITAQHSASHANNSFRCRIVQLELL